MFDSLVGWWFGQLFCRLNGCSARCVIVLPLRVMFAGVFFLNASLYALFVIWLFGWLVGWVFFGLFRWVIVWVGGCLFVMTGACGCLVGWFGCLFIDSLTKI